MWFVFETHIAVFMAYWVLRGLYCAKAHTPDLAAVLPTYKYILKMIPIVICSCFHSLVIISILKVNSFTLNNPQISFISVNSSVCIRFIFLTHAFKILFFSWFSSYFNTFTSRSKLDIPCIFPTYFQGILKSFA